MANEDEKLEVKKKPQEIKEEDLKKVVGGNYFGSGCDGSWKSC